MPQISLRRPGVVQAQAHVLSESVSILEQGGRASSYSKIFSYIFTWLSLRIGVHILPHLIQHSVVVFFLRLDE